MSAPAVLARTDPHSDREGWLEARRRGLGGSDIAAVMGMHPFKTPLAVYLDKTGELPDDEAGHRAEWGVKLEDVVCTAAVEQINAERGEHGLPPISSRRRNAILTVRDRPWMLASIDREVRGHERGPGVLEAKTTGYWARQQWEEGDTLPDYYHCQVQWYLAVTGWTWGVIPVLWDTANLHIEYVERDQAFVDALTAEGERFWHDHVLAGNPPPAGAADDELTKQLHPHAGQSTPTVLPPEAADLIAERQAAKEAEDAAAERRKSAEAQLRQLIGAADEAFLPGDAKPAFTYREVTTERLDTKALREAHPDVAAEFTKASSHRRFHFKGA